MVLPPGQKYIGSFFVYSVLGVPKVDIEKYRLKIVGAKTLELTYEDLKAMNWARLEADFHCVEGWSIKSVVFEGPSLPSLLREAGLNNAKYVKFVGLDGYTSVVPVKDVLDERAILALNMNGRPLPLKHGFPARPVIPHLYGWKSAKWLKEVQLTESYVDGYWEARGYHERGNVWKGERFKSPSSKTGKVGRS